MPYLFHAWWADVRGKRSTNKFYAATLADAVQVLEDLVDISAASWRELRQNGSIVTVTSSKYQQPATSEAFDADLGTLEMRASSSRARHVLTLHAVRPSYLNEQAKSTTTNPFRDIGKIQSSEGETMGELVKAEYSYRNRRTKNI